MTMTKKSTYFSMSFLSLPLSPLYLYCSFHLFLGMTPKVIAQIDPALMLYFPLTCTLSQLTASFEHAAPG